MTKRKRSDSAAGRTEIVQGALSGAPKPPAGVTISEAVQPFWELVTTAKAKRAWTKNDLVMAAEVARCMYRLERISEELEKNMALALLPEGEEQPFDAKELEKRADMLAKRVRLLSAHLQIHAEATQGKSREQVDQNSAHRQASEFAEASEGDSLLAKPMH
ncbi:hypothetical protein [Marinobacter sp. NSM]|uniref:hypothetical protein n=1 Tax=Marinobacter sp. NSM TaxID=3458004 RepID=UPI0040375D0E